MKLKIRTLLLSAALAAQAAPAYPAVPSAAEMDCAAEDMQVLYYYLAPEPGQAVKKRATSCHGAQTALKMPGWLADALPAMHEKKVWTDPEEGKLSEAAVWQTAFSILYELDSKIKETIPAAAGGPEAEPVDLESDFQDLRIRFLLSADRIARAGLESSFGGRGTSLLATMNMVAERLDALTGALGKSDKEGFYKSAGEAAKLSRDLFAQLFEKPRAAPAGKFTPKYTPEARIAPGYRGISLKVSGSQVMFLKSGERADMLVTFEAVMGTGTKEKVTATILQNVVVLKVFRPASPSDPGVVQLLCNPNEAQYAALSLAQGSNIAIVRRAEGDTEMRPMEIASFRKLFR